MPVTVLSVKLRELLPGTVQQPTNQINQSGCPYGIATSYSQEKIDKTLIKYKYKCHEDSHRIETCSTMALQNAFAAATIGCKNKLFIHVPLYMMNSKELPAICAGILHFCTKIASLFFLKVKICSLR